VSGEWEYAGTGQENWENGIAKEGLDDLVPGKEWARITACLDRRMKRE